MILNPTGGLRWHWKAWRAQHRWAATSAQLADWQHATTPEAQTLVIIGSSAGWMLTGRWLARFREVHTWDIDPLAGRLFAWRHGAALRESQTRLQHHTGDGMAALPQLTASMPQALFWFDNVLGQLRFLAPDTQQVESRLRQLRTLMREVRWGSVHDRFSGPTDGTPGLPLPRMGEAGWSADDPRTQDWLRQLHARSPWGDHLTQEVFAAGTPTLNLGWEIHPGHHHWLEAGWSVPEARQSGQRRGQKA